MKKIGMEIKGQLMKKSGLSLISTSPTSLIRKENNYEMSIYRGELTKICLGESIMKLKKTFPTLQNGFYEVFSDRITDNKFNNDRLKASINHVIDNCIYPVPTIAQFISFDKHIKLYTYTDVLGMLKENTKPFETYKSVRLKEGQKKPIYAHVNDIQEFNLESWNNESPEK